jgi:malate/lactate dehydrogenase
VVVNIMRPDSIAIMGIGRLGGSLAQELIRGNTFSKIYLYNRSASRLDSTVLSLRVFASWIGSQTEIQAINDQLPQDVAIVVIAVKEDYDPRVLLKRERLPQGFERNVRTIGIKKDLPLVRDVCVKLHGYTGKIVIVTNPVDIFTVLAKEWVPTAEVYGFGVTLDAARLAYCAQQHGIKCVANDCPLGGTHSEKLVQLRSLWSPQSSFVKQSELVIDELLLSASKIGPAIVRGLGFTLHDCAAIFSRDLAWFAGKDTTRKYLCASVGNDSSATAWPLEYFEETGRFEIFDELPENELCQLDNAAKLVGANVAVVRKKLAPRLHHLGL